MVVTRIDVIACVVVVAVVIVVIFVLCVTAAYSVDRLRGDDWTK